MQINLSPVRSDDRLILENVDDVLVVNGENFDFSQLPEGAKLSASAIKSPWFSEDVYRKNGKLHLTMILPHGKNAPTSTMFPVPIVVNNNGPINLPDYGE